MAAIFTVQVRLTKNQKERLKIFADGVGFKTISGYVRFMLFNPTFDLKLNKILEIVEDLQKKTNLTEFPKKQNGSILSVVV